MEPTRIFNRESLIEAIGHGKSPKIELFYGHHPAGGGQTTSSCLSQWWAMPFKVKQSVYPTAEHYMMAEKARVFGDSTTRAKILACTDPKQAKALGRQVQGFDEAKWNRVRLKIVTEANAAKFAQHPNMKDFLLGTGESVLVEASPYDRVWGIGLAKNDPRALNPAEWQGKNLLGFALMKVRRDLVQELTMSPDWSLLEPHGYRFVERDAEGLTFMRDDGLRKTFANFTTLKNWMAEKILEGVMPATKIHEVFQPKLPSYLEADPVEPDESQQAVVSV